MLERLPKNFAWRINPSAYRGGIAGMACPKSEDIETLKSLGVGAIVTLTTLELSLAFSGAGFRLFHFPIGEMEAPEERTLPTLRLLFAILHEWRTTSRPLPNVAVHCFHGRERTGLFLACYRDFIHHLPNNIAEPFLAQPCQYSRAQQLFVERFDPLSAEASVVNSEVKMVLRQVW